MDVACGSTHSLALVEDLQLCDQAEITRQIALQKKMHMQSGASESASGSVGVEQS